MLGKLELVVLLFFSLWCHDLFALSLGVIDRLCSVIVAHPGHILYNCSMCRTSMDRS